MHLPSAVLRRAALCGVAAWWLAATPLAGVAQEVSAPPSRDSVTGAASADAVSAAPAELERGILEMFVNGRHSGESIVLIGRDDLLVPLADLYGAGLTRLRAQTRTYRGTEYVSLAGAPGGLSHTVDMAELTLRIDAPAALFGAATVDLSSSAPEGMRHASDPAIFLNYAPRLIDGERIEGFGELGGSFGPVLTLGTMSHNPDYGAVRLLSQVIIDDRERLLRVTVGDTVASSGALGGGAMLGGLSIASNLDLDPYLTRLPTLGFNGAVTSPSTLEVYVNDSLVRTTQLAPGEFQVTNLPPVTGAGQTRYVIRDALGHEQRVQSPFYATSGLLAPGLSEYSYSVGLVRELYGIESLSYGDVAFIGRHRHGFTAALSGGARLEMDTEQVSGGFSATVAPGLGELEIAASASATWDGHAGGASQLGYSFVGRPFSFATVLRATSRHYTTVSLQPEADRNLFEHATTASVAVTTSLSFAARVIYALPRDREHVEAQLGLDVVTRVIPELVLTIGCDARYTQDASWVYAGMAAVRIALPEHHSASLGTRVSSSGVADADVQISRPIRARTGSGYQIGGAVGSAEGIHANVRARTGHGTLDATYSYLGGRHSTVLRGAVGLVLVPGEGLFLRDPIEQSFAVVRIPDAPGVRVYMNNQEAGRTDSNGRLFLQGLQPFLANRIRIEGADLPMDYDVDELEQIIAPSFRGGARVEFPGRRVRFVRGRVAFGRGSSSRWASLGELELRVEDQIERSLLGANGEFEFDGVPAGSWTATVRSADGECELTLVVPESEEVITEIGVVRCPNIPQQDTP